MKKETKIATNLSSGAEKVETVEKEIKKEQKETPTVKKEVKSVETKAKGDAALGDSVQETKTKRTESVNAKKLNTQHSGAKAERESEAAKKRVEIALKKKEEKEKRKAERAKKRAEKESAQKAKKEAMIRERAHKKANKTQARAKKKAEKQRKSNKGETGEKRESRTKGYGGWIAAVVTLGVTTLALATTVTVGGIEMMNTRDSLMGANKGTMYELNGIIGHMDDDLDRVRISASSTQQSRILTDLLVQARLAEADLEKLPISVESNQNVTVYLNRTAAACEKMLAKLRNGGSLSEGDMQQLEALYKTNRAIRQQLEETSSKMTDKDLWGYMKKGEGLIADALQRLENSTLEENRLAMESEKMKMEGAGMRRNAPIDPSKSEGERIESIRAEELCKEYFKEYGIEEYQCIGETTTHLVSAYNVQGYDKNGTMLFAEVSQRDGALLRFDYYEDCSEEKFNLENAERIAQEFLTHLGYENMTVARLSGDGSTADFTFAYEEDGVLYYPDEIHVKVCRARGLVTGFDATKYLRNHRGRDEVNVKINLETAQNKLDKKLSVESSRLAVVKTMRGERPAYEFLCSYDNARYFVYIDGETGGEIAIINVGKID